MSNLPRDTGGSRDGPTGDGKSDPDPTRNSVEDDLRRPLTSRTVDNKPVSPISLRDNPQHDWKYTPGWRKKKKKKQKLGNQRLGARVLDQSTKLASR